MADDKTPKPKPELTVNTARVYIRMLRTAVKRAAMSCACGQPDGCRICDQYTKVLDQTKDGE